MKVQVGQKIADFSVLTIGGQNISVPDDSLKATHLQFRRFAGCPICNFHLQTFFKSREAIQGAGIREVIFFHSSEGELRKYQKEFAFATVADPKKSFYAKFGVGRSIWAGLHPKALWAGLKGMLMGKMGLKMENGPMGLPADILIDRFGTVIAAKYGAHAYDQWGVDELLSLAKQAA